MTALSRSRIRTVSESRPRWASGRTAGHERSPGHELGDVSAHDLCAFIERRYGVRIDPRFLPVYRACIRVREQEERARARAAASGQLPDSPPLGAYSSPGMVSPVHPSSTDALRAAFLASGPQ